MPLPAPVRIAVASTLAGTVAVAVWAALSRATGGSIAPPPLAALMPTFSWRSKVAKATIYSESGGRYDAINANTDGAGLSFGLIQWAQKPGSLGELLYAMRNRNPARFKQVFGPDADLLVAATTKGGVQPVAGAYLWQEPWLSRFRAAGTDPVFKAVQDDLVLHGKYMQGALDAAAAIGGGPPTERGLSLLFDRAVQQGEGLLKQKARSGAVQGATFDERAKSLASLMIAASPAQWRSLVQSRVAKIASDPFLSDSPVNMTA